MSQLNDISLVAQVVVFKNTRAFDQLVQKYQSPVRRFFLHLTCGDSELSDDLAQDTFIKAYTNLASFRNLSSFSTWLYRIAYNIFYDYIRSRKEMADLDTRVTKSVAPTVITNTVQRRANRLLRSGKWCMTRRLNPLSAISRLFSAKKSFRSLSVTQIAEGSGTNLHHVVLHGRCKHRQDCRNNGNTGRNGEKPPVAWKRKISNVFKKKRL